MILKPYIKRSLACGTVLLALAVPQIAQADVVIGPRFSYYFDNSNLRTSDLDGVQDARQVVDDRLTQDLRDASGFDDLTIAVTNNGSATNSDQVGFAMYGGMVNFGDDRDRFTLIAMMGKGSVTTELVSSRTTDLFVGDIGIKELSVVQTISLNQIDRIDLEASWQRRLDERFALTGGIRYERLSTSGSGAILIEETDGVKQFVAETLGEEGPTANLEGRIQPVGIENDRRLDTFSGRFGVTAFVPVNDGAVVFFSGMAHASYQPSGDFRTRFFDLNGDQVREEVRRDNGEVTLGPDIAVGAQFVVTDNLALDLRYRAILFFPLSGDFEFSDARANHGVNIGLSLRL